jgi:phage/plasmid-like protein (TIGR03299 family)
MAHNVETMAYAGEVPWHGLGVQVAETISVDEMLKAASLDWMVNKFPTYYEMNGVRKSTGKYALVRESDGKFLSNVSDGWEPCQNADAFELFNDFVKEGDMEMHTGGSLKDGQIVWGLAKMKDSFEVFKGDQIDQYLLLVNPHQFGHGIHVRSTPIRVVCNNTLSLSLGSASKVEATQNHRKVFDVEEMKQTLGLAREKLAKYKDMAEFLGLKRYDEMTLNEYMNVVFPSFSKKSPDLSRNAARAIDIIETQPGAEYAKGSWWQAFNAVTYLADHELGRNPDTRMQSAWLGANKDRKNFALEKAIEFAEAA